MLPLAGVTYSHEGTWTLTIHPTNLALTSTDPGPDFCTLCPDLCTLHPDLWTLCLWCFPSFNWCKHSTCTGGGCRQLQLVLVVLFHSATSADSSLAHVVVYTLQLALVVLFYQPTGATTVLALCGGGQWWWYVVACGGGGIYI